MNLPNWKFPTATFLRALVWCDINRVRILIGIAALIFLLCLCLSPAHAIEVPEYSVRYRAALEQAATGAWGLEAPVARLAAQIHQESNWKTDAASPYAQGLAQFTPPTARWLPTICPEIGAPDPWDANWSIRAIVCYDHYLYTHAPGRNECNRWAFALSDYNGGAATRTREQRLAAESGADDQAWWSGVEKYNRRGAVAWRENRDYVRRVLLVLEPVYIEGGWPGHGACL